MKNPLLCRSARSESSPDGRERFLTVPLALSSGERHRRLALASDFRLSDCRNRSTRRAGAHGGARDGRPKWLRILTITGGFSLAAMILKLMLVRILSESSAIRLAKTRKTADLQRSKTLDISFRNRKPWKVGNNGIQRGRGLPISPLTLLQLCQNYMSLCVRIGKMGLRKPALNA